MNLRILGGGTCRRADPFLSGLRQQELHGILSCCLMSWMDRDRFCRPGFLGRKLCDGRNRLRPEEKSLPGPDA